MKRRIVYALLAFAVVMGGVITWAVTSPSSNSTVLANPLGKNGVTPSEFVAENFIATSAEFNSNPPQVWSDFRYHVRNEFYYSCLVKDGFSPSVLQPLLSTANPPALGADDLDYPDVAQLEAGNPDIETFPNTSPAKPLMSASEQAAENNDLNKCNNRSLLAVFYEPGKILGSILDLWQKDLTAVSNAPSVQAATLKWSACVARQGLPASSPSVWFGNLQKFIQTLPAKDQPSINKNPEVVARVKIYGRCVGPLANAMDQVRLKDRAEILNRYGSELVQLSNAMNRTIIKWDNAHGLKAS